MQDIIELRGSYRYPDVGALDRALVAVRQHLDGDELGDPEVDWMSWFVKQGSRLWVRGEVPGSFDPFRTAHVIETLAASAIEGMVEVRKGERSIDFFPCGSV